MGLVAIVGSVRHQGTEGFSCKIKVNKEGCSCNVYKKRGSYNLQDIGIKGGPGQRVEVLKKSLRWLS